MSSHPQNTKSCGKGTINTLQQQLWQILGWLADHLSLTYISRNSRQIPLTIISYTFFWDDVLCRMKVTLKKTHQKRAFSPRTSWSSGTKRSFWLPAWSLHRSFQRWLPWQWIPAYTYHIYIYTCRPFRREHEVVCFHCSGGCSDCSCFYLLHWCRWERITLNHHPPQVLQRHQISIVIPQFSVSAGCHM